MKGKFDIIRGTINHRKLLSLVVFLLIVFGIFGMFKMNKDEYPTVAIKQGLVVGVYPGATPKEVKEQLTKPIEETLFSFPEVIRKSVTSYSRSGICYIYVDLNCPAEKKDEVWSKIKLKLAQTKLTLPTGVLAVAAIDNFSNVSALIVSMESDDKGYDELYDYAKDLASRLRKLETMSAVTILGNQQQEIAVTIDADRLAEYSVSPASLAVDYQTTHIPLVSAKVRADNSVFPLYVNSPITSEQQIADYIIYSDPQGGVVRLKDIANIDRRYKKHQPSIRHNGKNVLAISVEMRVNNDIVAFGQDVDKILKEFSQTLPPSVKLTRITDQPKVVGTSVSSFIRDLLVSMAVVILVMLMFFPIRSALIASSGVPVCTFVSLAIMYLCGMELNTVTLAALIVVLGMIVDDSVITIDGYMVHLSKQPALDRESRINAAVGSAKELFMPMFMATAAISLMFFPIKKTFSGYFGQFVSFFPWVNAIALTASLVYAVLVVPSLEVKFIRKPIGESENSNFLSRAQNRFFEILQRGYNYMQAVCFKYPKTTLFTGLSIVALAVFIFLNINIQMMPLAARDFFAVEVYLPANSSIEATEDVVKSLEERLLADERVKSVTSFIGQGTPRFNATYTPLIPGDNIAQLIVKTHSSKVTDELLDYCQNNYHTLYPQANLHFKQMDYRALAAPVDIQLSGAANEVLYPFADSIRTFMLSMNELEWVHSDCNEFISTAAVNMDGDEAARLGVNKTLLAFSLSGVYGGTNIASLWEGDDEISVNLYTEQGNKASLEHILANQVPTHIPAVNVPLSQIADIEPQIERYQYVRNDGADIVKVSADMKHGVSYPVVLKQIKGYIDEHIIPILPEGVEIEYKGLSSSNKAVGPEMIISFICAVTILFLFLLLHFRKVSLASLTIGLSILCLFGAFFGLWLFGLDFGITSVLGLISLVGIIVRNGIIMFEYAEELRFEHGYDVKRAAEEAGKRRMRPIFLTSFTTALGVIPMIISADALWMPLGVVVCFGTLLTVVLITLIMPVSYWMIFRRK